MKPDFARWFKGQDGQPALPTCLLPKGHLRFLVDASFHVCEEAASEIGDDAAVYALDMQFRPGNLLYLYHGSGRILTIKFNRRGEVVKTDAAQSFRRTFPAQYAALDKAVQDREEDSYRQALKEILLGIRRDGRKAWTAIFWNRKEGYWQNRLSESLGRLARDQESWVVVDRESEITFPSEREKEVFFAKVKGGLPDRIKQLQQQGRFNKGTSLNAFKPDFLAIGPLGELVCLELKHGSNSRDLYWSPFKAAIYRDSFRLACQDTSFVRGLCEMVRQKVALGILPRFVEERLPDNGGNFPCIEATVVIAEPGLVSRESWRKIARIQADYPRTSVPVLVTNETEGGLQVHARHVWNCSKD